MNLTANKSSLAETSRTLGLDWKSLLLLGGAASFLLYLAMDTVAALRYDGYSYIDQTISELSAVDAPTRPMWIPLGIVYGLLMLAFSAGLWMAAGQRRSVRALAVIASVITLLALVAWPFAPMHQREVLAAGGDTFSDTLHIILGAVDTTLYVSAIVIGICAWRGGFRKYSIATLLVVLVAGAWSGLQSPKIDDNGSTPWLGIAERVALFGSMLWMGVLGLVVLRESRTAQGTVNANKEA
jgi:hypothetical protein